MYKLRMYVLTYIRLYIQDGLPLPMVLRATHCNNTLQQHTATHCNNTLQHTATTHCNTLQLVLRAQIKANKRVL